MITREIAGQLYGKEYKIISKYTNVVYDIMLPTEDDGFLLSIDGVSALYINWEDIGKDYFVLCRPYSDLTKEIEPGVVPLVQCCKMFIPEYYDNGTFDENNLDEFEESILSVLIKEHDTITLPVAEQLMRLHFPINLPGGCWKEITI